MARYRVVLSTLLAAGSLAALALIPAAHAGTPGTVHYSTAAARDTDPVVLTGKDLMTGSSQWSVPENATASVPEKDLVCYSHSLSADCPDQPNSYVTPDADTSTVTTGKVEGTATDKILGYKWDGNAFVEIPFQVDEVFTRYLNNDASGFGIYSGTDKHTTYAYDREGFRFTENGGDNGCRATMKQEDHAATDPVVGMDSNDEMAFMASDAGGAAPGGTSLPDGINGMKVVTIADPTNPKAQPKYVYIMRAKDEAGAPTQVDAAHGYVHYQRDANADVLAYSKSSYGSYGPAKVGPYCNSDGTPALDANGNQRVGPRRELDGTTISTDRYQYRYDGRWLMTGIQIADDGLNWSDPNKVYGQNIVDRWKARAFAQDPGSTTPCCGYEEEDTNWGGSSTLLGERTGPVRAIRETWGADSGTNVIRRETFYRDRMTQKTWLRVHVIPPLDGIYAQWDFRAGRVNRFYNSENPNGVTVDGRNDEVYGNWDDPCNPRWDHPNGQSQADATYRQAYEMSGLCTAPGFSDNEHASIDPGDMTFGAANASLDWSETAGPYGTIVDRLHAQPTDLTPGGAAQSIAAVPYYRDDACFDDGTGSDPGPELHPRDFDQEQASTASDGSPRRCWNANNDAGQATSTDPAVPGGNDQFWQGDIGTHGLHLLFQADSDNARLTQPIDEIVSDWDLVMLPPTQENQGNVGEKYGRPLEKPLVSVVSDQGVPSATALSNGRASKLH
jgi:hypothetical protein